MCVCILCMYMWHALVIRRTIQTWNLVLIQTSYKNSHVVWFEKVTPSAARLEKLPCHVDFPHISSIALFVYLFICVTSPEQPKNDSDLKFDTYSHWPYLKNCFFFRFFEKITVTSASLEKLPCYVIFRISPRLPCVFICAPSPGQTKNDTDLKFGTHVPIDNTSIFVFSKKWSRVAPASKNCGVTWIFRISRPLLCLCIYFTYLFVSPLLAN